MRDADAPLMSCRGFWCVCLLLFGIVAAGFGTPAMGAPAECVDLPSSTFEAHHIWAAERTERHDFGRALNENFPDDFVAIRHPAMLVVSNVVGSFDVRHRMVSSGSGMVCNAPVFVKIALGSTQRIVVLSRSAAKDECVRGQLLDHEEAHALAINRAVNDFIDAQKPMFQRGLQILKQTASPTENIARDRWYAGLQMIVTAARLELIERIREAAVTVDEPLNLARLSAACDGKVGGIGHDDITNP